MTISGYTVKDMADICGVSFNTMRRRVFVLGLKEISRVGYTRIYDTSALDAVRSVPGRGRPKRAPESHHTDV